MRIRIKITQEVLDRSRNCQRYRLTHLNLAQEITDAQRVEGKMAEAIQELLCVYYSYLTNPIANDLLRNCMVSDAIRDIFPDAITTNDLIHPDGSELGIGILIPEEIKPRIKEFDFMLPEDRALMKPFSFEIVVPEEVIDQISLKKVHEILSTSKSLEFVEA